MGLLELNSAMGDGSGFAGVDCNVLGGQEMT